MKKYKYFELKESKELDRGKLGPTRPLRFDRAILVQQRGHVGVPDVMHTSAIHCCHPDTIGGVLSVTGPCIAVMTA